MRRRRILAAAAAATVVVALSACNSSDDSGGASGGGNKPYIAIVSKGFQHQFWQAVKQGAEHQAAKEGARITFEGPATEADVEAQVTMLTNVLAKKPAAIGFAALDSRAAAPLLEQAKARLLDGLTPYTLFERGYLERLLAGRLGGVRPRHGVKIWLLLTLEAWLRTVFQG